MARTLQDILIDANSYLSLDASVPTGTDLTTWSSYAHQAVRTAASATQLPQFHKDQFVSTSGGVNGIATLASISLASNFRDFEAAPRIQDANGTYTFFEQIDPIERFNRASSDRYCYVLGNAAEGFTAVFNNLTANATLSIPYQRFPSGLLTLTDPCELDDDLFVVEKVKSYVLQARTDERFPIVEANANQLLKNMIGRQSRRPLGGTNTTPKVSNGFRIGE